MILFVSRIIFRTCVQRKRLNIPRILAWGGIKPRILIRLNKVNIRSIFEYGSVCFLYCPDATISIIQKIQNRAIRICLRLPRYVSWKLLHESASVPFIKERLIELGSRLVARMRRQSSDMRNCRRKRE